MAVVASRDALPAVALVRREFLSELRRPRAFAVILAFGLIALSVAAASWPDNVYSLRLASFFANEFFQGIAFALFGVVILCVPALSAGAIVVEREQDTFDLVRMSLISSTGFVFAKLLNGCGLALTLLIGLTPVLGTVFFLAGIDLSRVIAVLIMLGGACISVTSVALLSSACFRRTTSAVIGSYAGIAALTIAPLVVVFFVLALLNMFGFSVRSFQGVLLETFVYASLAGAFIGTLEGEIAGVQLLVPLSIQLGISALCLAGTIRRVHNPPPPPKVEIQKPIDDPDVLRARRRSFPYYLIDPLKKQPPVEDGRNPMLVREIRWGLMNRGTMLVRLFYGSLIIYFFASATLLTLGARGTDIRPWLVAQIVMTLCIAPALLANAFTKERELGNLDMLRMTLLRGRDVVYGKLFSGAVTLAPVIIAAVLSIIPLYMLAGLQNFSAVITGYITLFACSALALSLSLLGSLLAARTSTAIAYGYGFVALTFLGFWFGASTISQWAFAESTKDAKIYAAMAAAFASPVTAYLQGVDYNFGARDYRIGYPYWLSNIVLTLACSLGIVRFVAWYFERHRMTDR